MLMSVLTVIKNHLPSDLLFDDLERLKYFPSGETKYFLMTYRFIQIYRKRWCSPALPTSRVPLKSRVLGLRV